MTFSFLFCFEFFNLLLSPPIGEPFLKDDNDCLCPTPQFLFMPKVLDSIHQVFSNSELKLGIFRIALCYPDFFILPINKDSTGAPQPPRFLLCRLK